MATVETENSNISPILARGWSKIRGAVDPGWDVFKSRDITLPTKVRLVKGMVFPVVMYGCESWTVTKAEHQRIDGFNCGIGEDS